MYAFLMCNSGSKPELFTRGLRRSQGRLIRAQVFDLFPLCVGFTHREPPDRLGVSGPGNLLLPRRLCWCAVSRYCRQAESKQLNSRVDPDFLANRIEENQAWRLKKR